MQEQESAHQSSLCLQGTYEKPCMTCVEQFPDHLAKNHPDLLDDYTAACGSCTSKVIDLKQNESRSWFFAFLLPALSEDLLSDRLSSLHFNSVVLIYLFHLVQGAKATDCMDCLEVRKQSSHSRQV